MENAKVALMFGVMVGALWVSSARPASSAQPPEQSVTTHSSGPAAEVKQKWEYRVVKFSFMIAGMAGSPEKWVEIDDKKVKEQEESELIDKLARQGWEVVASSVGGAGYGLADSSMKDRFCYVVSKVTLRRPL